MYKSRQISNFCKNHTLKNLSTNGNHLSWKMLTASKSGVMFFSLHQPVTINQIPNYRFFFLDIFSRRNLKEEETTHRGRKGILKYFGFWDFLALDYAIVPN